MAEDRDWEAEARQQGWKPKEEFEGDNWTDAKTFVEKGEKITPILKSRLDRAERKIQQMESANREFGEYQKKLREQEREKAERRIAELEAERAQAINDGDGTKFTKLDREIDETRKGLEHPPPSNGQDPYVSEWLSVNDWYGHDMVLTAFADGVAPMVESEGYTGKARLDEIARRTREEFSQKFSNPRKEGSNNVEDAGDITVPNEKARTYENLPPDAKAACDRFVASGLTTKEDYVEDYAWD